MNYIKKILNNNLVKTLLCIVGVILLLTVTTDLFAADGAAAKPTISNVQKTISSTAFAIVGIINNIALVAGIGFLLASFFKFDQHKKNPTQIPISQPLTLLLIGGGLCMLPTIMPLVQTSVFGTKATTGKLGTSTVTSLIGTAEKAE